MRNKFLTVLCLSKIWNSWDNSSVQVFNFWQGNHKVSISKLLTDMTKLDLHRNFTCLLRARLYYTLLLIHNIYRALAVDLARK